MISLVAAVTALCAVAPLAYAQDATLPPPAAHATLTVQGRGVQIYTCAIHDSKGDANAPAWVFVAPAARLFDQQGIEIGTHGDGPVWHLQDGSSLLGKVIARKPSPDAGSVPWLLLSTVSTTGTGALTAVQFIRRSETSGGAAPATGCDASHLGDLVRVPYTTTYTFYSAQ